MHACMHGADAPHGDALPTCCKVWHRGAACRRRRHMPPMGNCARQRTVEGVPVLVCACPAQPFSAAHARLCQPNHTHMPAGSLPARRRGFPALAQAFHSPPPPGGACRHRLCPAAIHASAAFILTLWKVNLPAYAHTYPAAWQGSLAGRARDIPPLRVAGAWPASACRRRRT